MTLTQAAKITRLSIAGLLVSLILVIIVRVGIDVRHALFPPKPPPEPTPSTNVAYGKLPPVPISPIASNLQGPYTFQLDLVDAVLPDEPKVARVYPILRAPYGFLSPDRAKEIVSRFNLLSGKVQALSATEKIWSVPSETIQVNEQTLNFVYRYNFRSNPSVLVSGQFATQDQALRFAVDQMGAKQLLGGEPYYSGVRGKDLADGQKWIKLITYRNRKLEAVSSVTAASIARVDFFRDDLDGVPVQSPRFNQALVYILVSGGSSQPVLELNYTYWVLDRNQPGLYPIKTASTAWSELQQTPTNFLVSLAIWKMVCWRWRQLLCR